MEWKILILVIVIIALLLGAWYGIKLSLKEYNNSIWVYTKTGKFYTPVEVGKMKNPNTGEWVISVVYKDERGNVYIRDRKDFLDKFVKLSDFENGNKGK